MELTVTDIRNETPAAKVYFLEPSNGSPVPYLAGQFLTIILQILGREVRRSYSLCSTPGIDDRLAIAIKRVKNGEVSRLLLDTLERGSTITSLLPAGRFVVNVPIVAGSTFVFISAGSGITPVYALIRQLLYFEPQSKVVLMNQNHDEQSIIFNDDLELLQSKFSERFVCRNFLSNPRSATIAPLRLNNGSLETALKPLLHSGSEFYFYLSGPNPFIRMAEFSLRVMGFDETRIKKENFQIEKVPAPSMNMDTAERNVTIRYNGNEHTLKVAYPKNILQAALDNGIALPYSCRGGRCSTCVARCTSGKVEMSINEVLTPADLNDGLILTCVGYARTDIAITYDR
jgi:ring-1,2-phenylacetyl-CoA epoxidase subunit PaaE